MTSKPNSWRDVLPIHPAAESPVARPLKVLEPLIKEDLKQGDKAAEMAGLPFYLEAGRKLREAKRQVGHGLFEVWVKQNFNRSPRQARLYMQYATKADGDFQIGADAPFSSLNDFRRKYLGHSAGARIDGEAAAARQRADLEAMRQQRLQTEQEQALQRKLVLQLIDVGYKVLATKLHPDKGGSREAMTRLNTVRVLLKKYAGVAS